LGSFLLARCIEMLPLFFACLTGETPSRGLTRVRNTQIAGGELVANTRIARTCYRLLCFRESHGLPGDLGREQVRFFSARSPRAGNNLSPEVRVPAAEDERHFPKRAPLKNRPCFGANTRYYGANAP
jgi:hypothetical protein